MTTSRITNDMEFRLWQYLQGNCSPSENEIIETRLRSDAQWSAYFASLQIVHESLRSLKPESPSAGFSERVMSMVKEPVSPKHYINPRVVGCILLIFGCCLLYAALQPWQVPAGISSYANWSFSPAAKLSDSRAIMMILLMVNVLLALAYADKMLRTRAGQD